MFFSSIDLREDLLSPPSLSDDLLLDDLRDFLECSPTDSNPTMEFELDLLTDGLLSLLFEVWSSSIVFDEDLRLRELIFACFELSRLLDLAGVDLCFIPISSRSPCFVRGPLPLLKKVERRLRSSTCRTEISALFALFSADRRVASPFSIAMRRLSRLLRSLSERDDVIERREWRECLLSPLAKDLLVESSSSSFFLVLDRLGCLLECNAPLSDSVDSLGLP
jgi:hypothetical protein